MGDSKAKAIRAAATVVVVRDGADGLEALLLRRHAQIQFAGGMWVFPGGAVDAEDFGGGADPLAAARCAAAREAQEEAGLVMDPAELHYFAHWTTPEQPGKRYATWFFIAAVDAAQQVRVDGCEIDLHQWLRPRQALAAHRSGAVDMLPPTYVTLLELADCADAAAALALYRQRPVLEILPRMAADSSRLIMLYPGDAGYADCVAECEGPRHRCWQGDDGWHYQCEPGWQCEPG